MTRTAPCAIPSREWNICWRLRARKEGQSKQQAPPELLEEVFELNESLDELREAKASGGDTATLKHRLEVAEKHFAEKLREVDGRLQAAALDWDKAIDENADQNRRGAIQSKLNDLLNRRSYIRNLVVNVQKELLKIWVASHSASISEPLTVPLVARVR